LNHPLTLEARRHGGVTEKNKEKSQEKERKTKAFGQDERDELDFNLTDKPCFSTFV